MHVTYLTFAVDSLAFVCGALLYVLAVVGAVYLEESHFFEGYTYPAILARFVGKTIIVLAYGFIVVMFLSVLHFGTGFFVWLFPAMPHPAIYF